MELKQYLQCARYKIIKSMFYLLLFIIIISLVSGCEKNEEVNVKAELTRLYVRIKDDQEKGGDTTAELTGFYVNNIFYYAKLESINNINKLYVLDINQNNKGKDMLNYVDLVGDNAAFICTLPKNLTDNWKIDINKCTGDYNSLDYKPIIDQINTE